MTTMLRHQTRSVVAHEQGYIFYGGKHDESERSLDVTRSGASPRTVLLATSNGAGLGHVTRLMAGARRLPEALVPIFATQSLGASVVHNEGFIAEYVMSLRVAKMTQPEWHEYLFRRFAHLIEIYQPAAIVYDGVVPYPGMTRAWRGSGIPSAWLRRGLWRQGVGSRHIKLGKAFDAVLQPGDVASEIDAGPTSTDLGRTLTISPVTYLDQSEVEKRDTARAAVSKQSKPLALISLGAGNINDTQSVTARAVRAVSEYGFQPVVAQSPIAQRNTTFPGAETISVYPLSKYLRAFEFAVGAAGYNSVHEYLMAGVPSVLVPNAETGLDDQTLRSRYVERRGMALAAEDEGEMMRALELIADQTIRSSMRDRLQTFRHHNGADELAIAITELAGEATQAIGELS